MGFKNLFRRREIDHPKIEYLGHEAYHFTTRSGGYALTMPQIGGERIDTRVHVVGLYCSLYYESGILREILIYHPVEERSIRLHPGRLKKAASFPRRIADRDPVFVRGIVNLSCLELRDGLSLEYLLIPSYRAIEESVKTREVMSFIPMEYGLDSFRYLGLRDPFLARNGFPKIAFDIPVERADAPMDLSYLEAITDHMERDRHVRVHYLYPDGQIEKTKMIVEGIDVIMTEGGYFNNPNVQQVILAEQLLFREVRSIDYSLEHFNHLHARLTIDPIVNYNPRGTFKELTMNYHRLKKDDIQTGDTILIHRDDQGIQLVSRMKGKKRVPLGEIESCPSCHGRLETIRRGEEELSLCMNERCRQYCCHRLRFELQYLLSNIGSTHYPIFDSRIEMLYQVGECYDFTDLLNLSKEKINRIFSEKATLVYDTLTSLRRLDAVYYLYLLFYSECFRGVSMNEMRQQRLGEAIHYLSKRLSTLSDLDLLTIDDYRESQMEERHIDYLFNGLLNRLYHTRTYQQLISLEDEGILHPIYPRN